MYICNVCGAAAYFDGRMGDGPILTCGCKRLFSDAQPTNSSAGGILPDTYHNAAGAAPVQREDYSPQEDPDSAWAYDTRFGPRYGLRD